MSDGRTLWLAQDVQRHRRSLMIELKVTHGPVAIACDVVLCSHAFLQRAGGMLRDGFAAIADEAGCTQSEARAFVKDAAAIGWLDDLQVDSDGRRFNCRISGWKADQEKARGAERKRQYRAAQAATDDTGQAGTSTSTTGEPETDSDDRGQGGTKRDMTGLVPVCPKTSPYSTVQYSTERTALPRASERETVGDTVASVLTAGGLRVSPSSAARVAAKHPAKDAVAAARDVVAWHKRERVRAPVAALERVLADQSPPPQPPDPPDEEATGAWRKATDAHPECGPWLEGVDLAGVQGDALVLTAPRLVVSWLRARWGRSLESAAGRPILITEQAVTPSGEERT